MDGVRGIAKRVFAGVLLAAFAAVFLPAGVAAQGDKAIIGAGSSFINPLFSKIFYDYNIKTGIQVNYQSIGSGGGVKALMDKTVDFGASDAPLNEEQDAKMGAPVLHIPQASSAVVITYNLPGIAANINLSADVIADIFLGKIKKWSNARIKNLNKGLALPALPILIAHRSDGSGTTNIFTNYLDKISIDWHKKVGTGSAVNWPTGLGGKGNEGVAGLVKQIPGGIGYVELVYALNNKMRFAQVKNKKGKFILPSISSVTAASNVSLPEDAKAFITNTEAPDGYPISGFTWVIIYKEQFYKQRPTAKAEELLKLLWYNIHQGQRFTAALYYAPLSADALRLAEKILKSATYKGQPILK